MRRLLPFITLIACSCSVLCGLVHAQTASSPVGTFEAHGDVGTVLHKGSVEYMSANQSYRITGSGENIWPTTDAFQFAWKKMSGDISITADISFRKYRGGTAHKKAVLMIRQSLDADSAYADVALHANGLTSLQLRDEKGAATHEVQSVSRRRGGCASPRRPYYFTCRSGPEAKNCIPPADRYG